MSAPHPSGLTVGQRLLRALHDAHERWRPAPTHGPAWQPDATGAAANALIRARLDSGAPTLIGRFGASELEAMLRYLAVKDERPWRAQVRYLRGLAPPPWLDAGFLADMEMFSGLFPRSADVIARFSQLLLADMRLIDILGSWLPGDRDMVRRGVTAARIPLADLEPYLHENPWSQALHGRSVLVIHPFADLIESQYARRTRLFRDPTVLPEFELQTMTAVMSLTGSRVAFPDWFAALDSMIERVRTLRFDVAIIGAGAYGLPLAAAVKRLGKQAVHLGGATQILFGIRGNRWDAMPEFQRLFTDAWVRPGEHHRPPRWQDTEDGCYW